ncbi:hypothetical protein AM500_01550 [Bacillus sp. FJAT-18017]|uniref:hypothetical protein n=1 Tax=Bacillus sp. FJAT-18017 TaxID=1705566 RepID=UPI0006ADB0CA|nr:hypothetical protein [Bacillus sp. FJAT-18017]ALC88624.1 hypothetical protein AM500_01550 [Bacillus sp. FJAT-18017]
MDNNNFYANGYVPGQEQGDFRQFPGGGFGGGQFPGGGFPGGGATGGMFPGGGATGGVFPGGGQDGPPFGPPPFATPQESQAAAFAVDPGGIRRCLYRYTYIWLNNGNSFWFYPTFVGRTSIAGWRWRRRGWSYYGTDLRRIRSFRCF